MNKAAAPSFIFDKGTILLSLLPAAIPIRLIKERARTAPVNTRYGAL